MERTVRSTATWLVSENTLELYKRYDDQRWSKWVPIRLGCTRASRSTFLYRGRVTTDELQPTRLAHVEQEANFRVHLMASGQIQPHQRPRRNPFRRINGVVFDSNDWSLQHIEVLPDGGIFFADLI